MQSLAAPKTARLASVAVQRSTAGLGGVCDRVMSKRLVCSSEKLGRLDLVTVEPSGEVADGGRHVGSDVAAPSSPYFREPEFPFPPPTSRLHMRMLSAPRPRSRRRSPPSLSPRS